MLGKRQLGGPEEINQELNLSHLGVPQKFVNPPT